jgi:hypothetical protein
VRLRLTAISFLLLALAACGGGDDGRAKAEWIAGADAICARVNSEIDALGEADTLAEIAEYAASVRPIAERQLTDLANLEAPKEDREAIQAMLALVAQGVEKTGQIEAAARRGDAEATFVLVDEIESLTKRANALAREYGLADCAGVR